MDIGTKFNQFVSQNFFFFFFTFTVKQQGEFHGSINLNYHQQLGKSLISSSQSTLESQMAFLYFFVDFST